VFAIPGVVCLIVFILVRPQEFIPILQRVPFLHLFTALAVLGWVIDIRLRRLQPISVPTLPLVIAFLAWAIIGTAVVAPDHLIERGVEFAILFCLYAVIAHGVQKFRTFQIVAGGLVAACLFITVVCFHQGLAEKQCVAGQEGTDGAVNGKPDGRSCDTSEQCLGPDAEPGKEYRCEHVGAFGTYSVEERVRYRGELHDPNEVAMTISAGALSLLIAFALRKKNPVSVIACALCVLLVILTVLMTQSRGGQISAMLVPGVYLVRRYGWWAVLPAAAAGLALVLLGGRGGMNADVSTELRYEAWARGLALFKEYPVFGVGARLFNEHHFLTAHNSFVLTLAETGFVGMVLFSSILYLSMKMLVVGLRDLAQVPGSAAVQVWGMALMASLSGILFQINTLSFAYHSVLWLFLGLVGAWYSAIRHHVPDFRVRFGWKDLMLVIGGCIVYAFVFLPMFLRYKGKL
jgi:hypothetical protein